MTSPLDSWTTDVRVRERNLKSGKLDPKDLEKHLRELADAADKADAVSVPQPALAAPEAADEDEAEEHDEEDEEEGDEESSGAEPALGDHVATAKNHGAHGEETAELPGIDFSTFVVSLSHSALVHLGDAKQPDGTVERNLPLARQTIDILALLQDKTKGNLSGAEERLLAQVLYDLRMRFVEVSRTS